jgi:hypothetical protein
MKTIWNKEWKPLLLGVSVFALFYFLPEDSPRFTSAVNESLALTTWYAKEHVLLCLIPAFFIAGAIAAFVSQASVMKYLGATAPKVLAYSVASVSGTILAVCSCTVLPLFAGIYRMGAGLGPAVAFLYSGPAINVLAIVLTASVLGVKLGVARAVGAILFSVVIGLIMHFIFRSEELEKVKAQANLPDPEVARPLWQTAIYFLAMVGILVFANWAKPEADTGIWAVIYQSKWLITSFFSIFFAIVLVAWFDFPKTFVLLGFVVCAVLSLLLPEHPQVPFIAGVVFLSYLSSSQDSEAGEWFNQSWGFAKQIMPLLFFGVLIAGLLLGRPGEEGLIPASWISSAVGGNSFQANLFAAVAGAFMYFATLTEVPILQGLIGNGMGEGPALALLLAGPALSLPNMLVIRSVMGTKKTVVFVLLVVTMATISGMIFGTWF